MENEKNYSIIAEDFENISDQIETLLEEENPEVPIVIIQVLQEVNNVLVRELPHGEMRQAQMSTLSSLDQFRSNKEMLFPEKKMFLELLKAIDMIRKRMEKEGLSFPWRKAVADSQFKITPEIEDEKVVKLEPTVLQDVGSNTLA
jgi:hypothetical protein